MSSADDEPATDQRRLDGELEKNMWERRGLELGIYGELETCGLRLLACSKESRGRAGN